MQKLLKNIMEWKKFYLNSTHFHRINKIPLSLPEILEDLVFV